MERSRRRPGLPWGCALARRRSARPGYHQPRCSTGPAADGPRVISARLPGLPVRLDRRVRARRLPARAARRGRASRTSWSTSRSRARPATRRAAPSARRSRASAARRTRPRTASPPSTGRGSRGARRDRAMDVLGELVVRPRLDDADIDQERDGDRRGDPLLPRRPVRVRADAHPAGAVRRRAAGPRDLRRRGGHPRAAGPDDPRLLAHDVPPGEHGRGGRGRPVARRGGRACDGGVRHRATASMPRFDPGARRCPPGRGVLTGRRDTTQAQLAIAVPALRRDHPDAWNLAVLNAVLGDGMSSRLFLGVREEKGLAYDVSSGVVEYADAGALEISAGVDPAQPARGDRGDPRGAGPAGRRARPGRRARQGEGLPRRAASSCGWTTRATSRRGSAARRRSTTGCYTLDEALASVEAVKPGDVRRLAGRAVPRRRAADGRRRPRPLPARPRPPPAAAAMTEPAARDGARPHRGRPRPGPRGQRRSPSGSPASTCGWARSRSRAPSSSRSRAAGTLDEPALLDLAEVRWRTGDLAGAGEAAHAALARGVEDPLALRHRAPSPSPRSDGPRRRAGSRATRSRAWTARSTRCSRACPGARSGPPMRPSPDGRRSTPASHWRGPVAAGADRGRSRASASTGAAEAFAGGRGGARRGRHRRRPRSGSSVAIRLEPGFARASSPRSGSQASMPPLALVAGDALRLLGRESRGARRVRPRPGPRPLAQGAARPRRRGSRRPQDDAADAPA